MEDEEFYKKRYFELLKKISRLRVIWIRDRCPPFHQCCGACKQLEMFISDENDERHKRNTESDE